MFDDFPVTGPCLMGGLILVAIFQLGRVVRRGIAAVVAVYGPGCDPWYALAAGLVLAGVTTATVGGQAWPTPRPSPSANEDPVHFDMRWSQYLKAKEYESRTLVAVAPGVVGGGVACVIVGSVLAAGYTNKRARDAARRA